MVAGDEKKLGKTGRTIVIILRLMVGLTFVISGWAKSIDPWGFIYKIDEYMRVWNYEFPRELTLTAAVSLSVAEFTLGLMIAVGALRRSSVWIALAFMAVMLPLTAYIYFENPVSDCGCFGDLIVLSNFDTFVKNIILVVLIIILIPYNGRVGGLYAPGIQWLTVFGAVAFSLTLSFLGYRYQPLVDFRPYPTGSVLYEDIALTEENQDNDRYIYTRDGETRTFALDEIPDSTWTYVGAEVNQAGKAATLAVSDGEEDITEEVFNTEGDMLLLAVSDPGIHYLTRARLANELSAAVHSRGGRMIALVAADGGELDDWLQLALPSYEVYPSEDTSLKELVRGDAGLLYIHNGRIVWKRNMSSIRYDILRDKDDAEDFFSSAEAVDDGKHIFIVTGLFLLWMLFVYSLNFPNNILERYFERHSQKNRNFASRNNTNSTINLKTAKIMRKNIVAGNWKMNTTLQEGIALAEEVNAAVKSTKHNCDVVICVPFTHLASINEKTCRETLGLGAENCADHKSGAYTGEVSAAMVASTGATYVILGHSERRQYYGETSETLREKVALAFENNLTPIFCIGEVLEERENGTYFDVVKKQIVDALFHLSAEEFGKIILAYEPVWAIGTGKTATADQAEDMHAFIRGVIAEKYGQEVADNTSILYGGSCKPSNAKELFAKPDVDGGLIGGAALKCADFMGIVEAFN